MVACLFHKRQASALVTFSKHTMKYLLSVTYKEEEEEQFIGTEGQDYIGKYIVINDYAKVWFEFKRVGFIVLHI